MRMGTVAVVGLLVLGGTACGGGGGGSDEGGGGTVLTMLAAVPDTGDNRSLVTVSDYTALAEAAGEDWPPAGTGDEGANAAVGTFFSAAISAGLVTPSTLRQGPPVIDDWRTEFGFSLLDADAEVLAGVPPQELTVYRTTADGVADAIATAVGSDPVWSGDLTTEDHAGGTLHAWADPLAAQVDRTSGARRPGQGGALGVTDGRIVRTPDPEVARAALDTLAGTDGHPSLADDDTFAALARVLDDQGSYAATLSDQVPTLDPALVVSAVAGSSATPEEVAELLDTTPTLPPYTALGIGEVITDDGTPVEILAFATASAEQAAETIERFTTIVDEGTGLASDRPWAELVTIRSSTVEGDVAVVVIEPVTPALALQSFTLRDTLLVAEA